MMKLVRLASFRSLPSALLGSVLCAGATFAAAPPPDAAVEEPEVTIIQREQDSIEEYRVQGRLYMIRVIPRRGVPYYLVDTDGDGNLETRRNQVGEDLLVPNWTLFRW
jgi:hypothetical protein